MEHMGCARGGALGAVLPLLLPWREGVVTAMCFSPGACGELQGASHGAPPEQGGYAWGSGGKL